MLRKNYREECNLQNYGLCCDTPQQLQEIHMICSTSLLRSKDTRRYTVLVGSLQVLGRQDSKTTIPVSRIIPHPDFQGNTSTAMAVVELAYPVSFSPVVLPICLPALAVQLKNLTSCWVTGWGYSRTYQSEDK